MNHQPFYLDNRRSDHAAGLHAFKRWAFFRSLCSMIELTFGMIRCTIGCVTPLTARLACWICIPMHARDDEHRDNAEFVWMPMRIE